VSRRCAVVGSPIAHSLSPVLHRAAYDWLGLDWAYSRHEVTPATLPGFVAGLDETWRGLSCTMPLKTAILDLGQPDATVEAVGVANTVVFDGAPGDPAATRVRNTDVEGLIEAVRGLGPADGPGGWPEPWPRTALVVGPGATGASAVYALAQLGLREVAAAGRSRRALDGLAERAAGWGVRLVPRRLDDAWPRVDLAISTVPAEVARSLAGVIVAAGDAVFDVLYDPWPTPLLARARQAGRATLTGRDQLVHQARGQVRLMTGRTVPVAVLRDALWR